MSTKIIKYLNIGLGIMLGISVILILNLLTNMDDPTKLASSLDGNFYWCYLLLGIGTVSILIYSLVQTFSSIEDAKKSLLPVGGLLVVFLFAYIMSSSEMPQFYGAQKLIEDGTLTPKVSKYVDTGLYSVYILSIVSVISLIYSSLARFWK
jgi:hypothetical protein